MRRTFLAVLAVLFVIVTGACSTTQPESGGKQSASLTVVARANLELVDCFEIWLDTNSPPDGFADTNTGGVVCDPAVGTEGKATRNLPWRYSLEVSIIPSGETTETLIGSSVVPGDSIDDFVGLTPFDATPPQTAGTKPRDGTTYYLNGKRVSQGSALYIGSLGIDVGQPNVLGNPSFDFKIGPGDTVIVRGRKQPVADAPNFIDTTAPDLELQIEGILTIGGVRIDVSGNPLSPTTDKGGFAFSFTKR